MSQNTPTIIAAPTEASSLYAFWKTERRVWLEGPLACREYIDDEAVLLPPDPFPPTTFAEAAPGMKRARPFDEVRLQDRRFIQRNGAVVLIYRASAKHPRYKRRYCASCMTTYGVSSGKWKIVAHAQRALKRGSLPD